MSRYAVLTAGALLTPLVPVDEANARVREFIVGARAWLPDLQVIVVVPIVATESEAACVLRNGDFDASAVVRARRELRAQEALEHIRRSSGSASVIWWVDDEPIDPAVFAPFCDDVRQYITEFGEFPNLSMGGVQNDMFRFRAGLPRSG